VLDVLATPVGQLLNLIHEALSSFLISGSGPAWALSIVLLTCVVRLLLFPLFVKQIKSQRRMQQLAPKVRSSRQAQGRPRDDEHRDDEAVQGQRRQPVAGCLPLLLQLPVFFACSPSSASSYHAASRGRLRLSAEQLPRARRQGLRGADLGGVQQPRLSCSTRLGRRRPRCGSSRALMVVRMGATTF
jgi:YidC/Oxa1 family membrane protein insertase